MAHHRPSSPPLRAAVAAVVASLFAGPVACGDRGGRLETPATFTLVTGQPDGRPLVLEADSACNVVLQDATLHFPERRTYRAEYRIERVCGPQGEPLPDPGASGRYRIRGDSMFFADTQGNATGAGLFAGDSIVIAGPVHTLTFRRRADQ